MPPPTPPAVRREEEELLTEGYRQAFSVDVRPDPALARLCALHRQDPGLLSDPQRPHHPPGAARPAGVQDRPDRSAGFWG
ncbi:MAG: hypothetical protein MZV70_29000 [Desulfobacterales bacterium]|nr:hypothetical protein [Desulfobacterales bacterium]